MADESSAFIVKIHISGHMKKAIHEARERLFTSLGAGFRKFARAYQRRLTRTRMSGQHGNVGLNRETGKLASTFTYATSGNSVDNLALHLIFGVPYARVHEYGGRVDIRSYGVRQYIRGGRRPGIVSAHTVRAHSRLYRPRLEARRTLASMQSELQAACNEAAEIALRPSGGKA